MKSHSKLSNDFLIKELRNRLSVVLEREECDSIIYKEFMQRAHRRFKFMHYMSPDNILKNGELAAYFRLLSTKARDVDRNIKNKTLLTKIEALLEFISEYPTDQNFVGVSIEEDKGKGNIVIAKILVNGQVKKYTKEAFLNSMFDTASTPIADAADILDLAQAIYAGDLKKAYKLNNFDTVVREDIPQRAWDWMEKHLKG